MDTVTRFNRFYLYLVIACGAACAIGILLAVYLSVLAGLLLAVCIALLYSYLVPIRLEIDLRVSSHRVSDGWSLSLLPKSNTEALTVPSHPMWLDVTELSPAKKKPSDGTLRCLYLPRSILRIQSGALACLAEEAELYYEGTETEWNAVQKEDDLSGLCIRFEMPLFSDGKPSEQEEPQPNDSFETFDP